MLPFAGASVRARTSFASRVTRKQLYVNLGSWCATEAAPSPAWERLQRAAVWTEECEATAWLREAVVGATQRPMDEGAVGLASVDTETGTPLSVFVFDGTRPGLPSELASMSIRAAVVAVEPSRDGPALDNLVCEKVPILLWGEFVDVEQVLDMQDLDSAGSRVVRLKLYLRPRVPVPGAGLRFREQAIAILGDAGRLQPQVRSLPLLAFCCTGPNLFPNPAAAGCLFFVSVSPTHPLRMHAPLSRGGGCPPGSLPPGPTPSPPQFPNFVLV